MKSLRLSLLILTALAGTGQLDGQNAHYAPPLEDGSGTPRTEITPSSRQRGRADVSAFGALGDGTTDDTGAFQRALDAVAADGGGLVTVPAGRFLIASHLNIPKHVTLEGVWRSPQIWAGEKSGTVLLAVEGKGEPDGMPFITMNTGSTLTGVVHLLSRTGARQSTTSLSLDSGHPWVL